MLFPNRTIGVNLGILTVFRWTVSMDAAPMGLGFLLENAATQIPSLRDSRGFWSLQDFRVESGSVRNARRIWVSTPQNRIYRAGGEGGYFF